MLNCSLDPVTRQENYLRLVLDLLLLPVISAHVRARARVRACIVFVVQHRGRDGVDCRGLGMS